MTSYWLTVKWEKVWQLYGDIMAKVWRYYSNRHTAKITNRLTLKMLTSADMTNDDILRKNALPVT